MTVALVPGAALSLIAAAIGVSTIDDPVMRLGLAGTPIIVITTILLAAIRATRPIHVYAGIQFILIPVLRPILLILAGGSLLLGFTAWLLPVAVALLIAAALAPRPARRPRGWRPFWSYALPRAASVAVDASSMWTGVLLTTALSTRSEAGLFGAAGRYALAGLLIMQGLRVAMAPHLSKLLAEDRRDEAAALYRRTTIAIVALSWPAYTLLAIFAPAFLALFGNDFAAAATPLAILSAAMLVNVGVGLVQTVLLMSGHSRGHLYATLTGLTCTVVAGLVLIPAHGATGAALAWSLGIVVENVLAAALARRVLRQPLFSRPLWLAVVGAVAVAGVAAAAGLVISGRDLPGLAIALVLLLLVAALTQQRGRRWLSKI